MCPKNAPPYVSSRSALGRRHQQILQFKDNPNDFAVSLMDAPAKEPLVCCASGVTAICGLPACFFRKKVLESFANGVESYVCCAGYFPHCCGVSFDNILKGQMAGLVLEGCLCPVLSLSFTRMLIMDAKGIRPDPVDLQVRSSSPPPPVCRLC